MGERVAAATGGDAGRAAVAEGDGDTAATKTQPLAPASSLEHAAGEEEERPRAAATKEDEGARPRGEEGGSGGKNGGEVEGHTTQRRS